MVRLFLHGLKTDATHIAFTDTGYSIAVNVGDGDPEPTPRDLMDTESYQQNYGKTPIIRIEARQTYYWLPLDCYNQPRGFVEEISLFPTDYNNIRTAHSKGNFRETYPYYWIFTDKDVAERRALD